MHRLAKWPRCLVLLRHISNSNTGRDPDAAFIHTSCADSRLHSPETFSSSSLVLPKRTPLCDLRIQVKSLGLPHLRRRVEMEEALAKEAPLQPLLLSWVTAIQRYEAAVLECILNSLCHLLLPVVTFDQTTHRMKEFKLRLPSRYLLSTSGRIQYHFLFLDTQEREKSFPASCPYFLRLETIRVEYEYYQQQLTALGICPPDVYQFSRVVRMASGLRPNIPLSSQLLLRVNCPTRLELQLYTSETTGCIATHTLERSLGVTIYDWLNWVVVSTQGTPLRFVACQVVGWKESTAVVHVDLAGPAPPGPPDLPDATEDTMPAG